MSQSEAGAGRNPKHWMRFLRTQSTKKMGGQKFQRTVARFMSDIYKMTQANEVPIHGRTQGNQGMLATESTNDLERLLRVLVSTVKL